MADFDRAVFEVLGDLVEILRELPQGLIHLAGYMTREPPRSCGLLAVIVCTMHGF